MSVDADSSDAAGVADNADWGLTVHTAALQRWPELVDRSHDENGHPEWYDAVVADPIVTGPESCIPGLLVLEADTLVETKATRYRVSNGREASVRRGRWLFPKGNHDRLVEAGGRYVLGVYDPDIGVLRLGMVRATTIDKLVTFSETPEHPDYDAVGQLSWANVFRPENVTLDNSFNGSVYATAGGSE